MVRDVQAVDRCRRRSRPLRGEVGSPNDGDRREDADKHTMATKHLDECEAVIA
jgi:hypothetical protein